MDLDKIIIAKNRVQFAKPYAIQSEALENLPFSSLVEALSITPVDLQARSPHAGIQTDFSLRGSNFQDVLVLFNHQRINDPQTAHHNSDIPLTSEDIEKVEVLPQAASSVYGPDAIGGAINFMLKRPQERKMVLKLSGGDFKTFSEFFSASDKIKGLGLRLSVENRQSSGFHEDTDFKKFTTSFASSLDLPLGSVDLNTGYQKKEFGAFDFYTPGKSYPSKEWTRTFLLDSGINLDKEGLVIKPHFIWRRHFDKFVLDKTLVRSSFISNHRTDIYTPSIYFQKDTLNLGKIGFGLEYGQERITSTTLGRHNRDHKSLFLDNSLDLTERLSSGASFRWDDFDGFDNAYTGSLSLRYEIIKQNFIHCGISRSIRIPSFTELYYSDPTTVGDPSLSSEKSLNYEVGYEIEKKEFLLATNLFIRREDNFIDWVKTDASQTKWQATNITGADVLGVEARFDWHLDSGVDLTSNYTYINKYMKERGYIYKYGQNYSRHLFNSELNFKLPFGSQSLGFTYKEKPGRSGWFLLNASLNYNLNRNARLFFAVTNLFNVKYEEIEGIPQPGRWSEGGLRLEW